MLKVFIMLVSVAINQVGFKIPGVTPDARGVLLGKQGAVLLASLDQVVAFFRMLSEESPLDDLLPGLHIYQVRSRLESQELLVLLQASNSYLMDRCARVAALLSGLCCTGSGRHFVRYRDRQSPLGYDSDELYSDGGDFILYETAFVQAYRREREISFGHLLLRLAPRPLPGGLSRDVADGDLDVLYMTARGGLARELFRYLWRSRVQAQAAFVELGSPPPLAPLEEARRRQVPQLSGLDDPTYVLLRLSDLPERTLRLLVDLPGVALFRPLGDNFAVELGYRHVLRLESCASLFDKERFYLFSGQRGTCDIVVRPPLVPVASLLRTPLSAAELAVTVDSARVAQAHAPAAQQITLRLQRSLSADRRATATLIPWSRLGWFKKLVYALPPAMLRTYRAAAIDEGLLVLCPSGVDSLPIGELLREAAPAIFVPLGMDFSPRVDPEVLTEQVGGVAGRYLLVLPAAEGADAVPTVLAVPHGQFEALGRRSLAPLAVATRSSVSFKGPSGSKGGGGAQGLGLRPRPQGHASLINDPVLPAFPLWGFRGSGGGEEP